MRSARDSLIDPSNGSAPGRVRDWKENTSAVSSVDAAAGITETRKAAKTNEK
jgi:hypothetical protein